MILTWWESCDRSEKAHPTRNPLNTKYNILFLEIELIFKIMCALYPYIQLPQIILNRTQRISEK
jgi:hypothetical protein